MVESIRSHQMRARTPVSWTVLDRALVLQARLGARYQDRGRYRVRQARLSDGRRVLASWWEWKRLGRAT